RPRAGRRRMPVLTLEVVVNLDHALSDQKQTAGEQDQVLGGDVVMEQRQLEERLREPHEPGDAEKEEDARDECEQQASLARPVLLRVWQLPREDRNEDDVIDAENDLEGREGQKG